MSDSRYRADDGATLRRIVEVVQRLLVGLALLLACTVVGALPAAAQNGVGVSTPVMINTVGAATDIGAGQRLGETVLQPVIVVATERMGPGPINNWVADQFDATHDRLERWGGANVDSWTYRTGTATGFVVGTIATGGTSAAVRGSAEVIEAGAVVKSASVAAEDLGVGVVRHYTTDAAAQSISKEGVLRPGSSGKTWLTPDEYASGAEARAKLALDKTPDGYYEIPMCRVQCRSGASRVAPLNGQPGGGTEITTEWPIDVSGLPFNPFGGG